MNSNYLQPQSLEEALMFASGSNNPVFVAGGTDVLVNMKQGNILADTLIDLSNIGELRKIEIDGNKLLIGSLATLWDLTLNQEVQKHFPLLCEAALSVASPVIRKTATIGGNILCENRCIFFNQSEWWRKAVGYCLKCNGDVCIATGSKKNCYSRFVSDTAPALIAYNAMVVISGSDGEKTIPLEELYTGDGILSVNKIKNTLLKNIVLPLNKGYTGSFNKLRPRKSLDFTSLTTAVTLANDGEIRIVLGGIDPMPVLITGRAENREEMIKQSLKKPRAVNNDYYSRNYRREMIQKFVSESLSRILG